MDYMDELSYSRAERMDRERRRKNARMRRERKKYLRRIRAAVLGGTLVIIAGACALYSIRRNNVDFLQMDTRMMSDNEEALAVAALEHDQTDRYTYPAISQKYKNITEEEIKSPYIALLDVDNNQVLAGRAHNEKIYPASMTKVMTLIIAVENIKDLNKTYALSYAQLDPLVKAQASRAGFDPEEMVTANDYLYGLILPSGADAAVALSQMAAGSEEAFVKLMNDKCKELGLKNTHFTNASGLNDSEQYTTPLEMAIIMQYAMKNSVCAKVLSTFQYTTAATAKHPEGIALTNTMFSRMYGTEVEGVTITAGKTGYTQEAGNCLVSYAVKNGHAYIAVTAHASNKWHVIFDDFKIYEKYLL